MNASLFMQLVMISVAVVIGFAYIEPTIAQIKENQDSTYAYQLEIQKVAAVTNALKDNLVKIDSVPNDNARALETYLPDYLDEIKVTKDIKKIVETSGGILSALTYVEAEATESLSTEEIIDEETGEVIVQEIVGETPIATHTFTVGVDVTYTQLKQLIDAFAVNEYPLHIKNLSLAPSESGFVTSLFTLETYSRLRKEPSIEALTAEE